MKVMRKVFIAATLLTAAIGAVPINAATTIDFSDQAAGSKPNGYTVSGVSFSDSIGQNLAVNDYGVQSIGNGLAVYSDDASVLQMTFATLSTNLSLVFGNDDPVVAVAGDVALLRLFIDNVQVGQTSVVLNRDDIANQTIALNGINFNRATFVYANAQFNPINLIEIVDNITFDAATVPAVPEPASWAMMLIGFGGIGAAVRRRKSGLATKVGYA